MKNLQSLTRVPFDELINLFRIKSENISFLEPDFGEGSVQVFDLEKGLQARLWNFSSKEGMELYSNGNIETENLYFNLAFFLNVTGLDFISGDSSVQESGIWDTVLISSRSDYKIYISPGSHAYCLSLSFSKKWLDNNVLQEKTEFKALGDLIYTTSSSLLLFESMTTTEKKSIIELFDDSWKKSLGSFYIKTALLKIISDFFYRIKERESFSTNTVDTVVIEVEKYLCNNLGGMLPNLKELGDKFCISESTLKRHFKKKYGVNMSTYFINKKMEYACSLIQEENSNLTEIGYSLGYRNINNFISMLQKYRQGLLVDQEEK